MSDRPAARRMLDVLGSLITAVGAVLLLAPTLVHDPGPVVDTFTAIERRIPWGGVLGLGLLILRRPPLRPYRDLFAAFVLWVTVGLLLARVVGLALDGADSGEQWLWVGVELAIALAAAAYLRVRSRRASGVDA